MQKAGPISQGSARTIFTSLLLGCSAVVYPVEPLRGGTVGAAISADPDGLNPAITTQGGVHPICESKGNAEKRQAFIRELPRVTALKQGSNY